VIASIACARPFCEQPVAARRRDQDIAMLWPQETDFGHFGIEAIRVIINSRSCESPTASNDSPICAQLSASHNSSIVRYRRQVDEAIGQIGKGLFALVQVRTICSSVSRDADLASTSAWG